MKTTSLLAALVCACLPLLARRNLGLHDVAARDLAEPSPSTAVRIWFYDHPPLDERILFAQTYDPWGKGESPAFVK